MGRAARGLRGVAGSGPRSRRRARLGIAGALALAGILVLGGCGLVGTSTPPSTPKPSTSTAPALSGLTPVAPGKLTADSAKSETVRVANAIQGLVAKTNIVYVDDHAQLVAATASAGSYYGVLRTINVSPTVDPIEQATAMAKLLEAAGWIERQTANDTGKYLVALSSDPDGTKAWFLLLGADSTSAKQPVVTVQLASPDLPAK